MNRRRVSGNAVIWFSLLGLAIVRLASGADLDLKLRSLEDAAETSLTLLLASGPAIVMFWRADCEPCLEELAVLDQLREAAAPLRLMLIGLDDPVRLRPVLERLGIEPVQVWQAPDDPAQILTDFGGYPPRLPLSVAFDSEGRLCARRTGKLAPGLAEEWRALCLRGSPDRPESIPVSAIPSETP